ncbi:MAG: type II secretion system GspH family protein [Bifidobacteriaceae bacterium]|jgi:prepilin-type N-terminal cleavage/methylation domain-containing protein|nr:type II secretion system GspH family protein [Bifidobacteriaceae bacterium]
MANSIWRGERTSQAGFSLVELLIVVIIMGVLAAIAIPLFLSQRAKAEDAQTKNDVAVMGEELAAHWTGSTTAPTITLEVSGGERTWHLAADGGAVTPATFTETMVGPVSGKVAPSGTLGTDWDFSGTSKTDWCFWAYNPNGKEKGYWVTATSAVAGTDGSSANPCNP